MEKLDLEQILGISSDSKNLKIALIGVGMGIASDLAITHMVMEAARHEFDRGLIIVGDDSGLHAIRGKFAEILPECEFIAMNEKEAFQRYLFNLKTEKITPPSFPGLIMEIESRMSFPETIDLVRKADVPKYDKHDRHKPKCDYRGKGNSRSLQKSYIPKRKG